LDIKVGIVYGIIFIPAGSYVSEGTGIDKLSAPETGFEDFAVSLASVNTSGT
jgi:hypothetical protein